jgi:hypothetical protein
MNLTSSEEYERLIIRAVLTNDTDLWTEANAFAHLHSFNAQQVLRYHTNVERWLRLHGITKMKDHEAAALCLIQASTRRWLVLNRIKKEYNMYYRLAFMDNHEHCKRALVLQGVLTNAWKHIHSRENVI